MARRAQTEFAAIEFLRPGDKFGGGLLKGNNPKTKRPLDSKFPIHLVLSSNKGVMRLPKNILKVKKTLVLTSKKHGVKIYNSANVGNHIHMVVKIPARTRWAAYIRELTGRIAHQLKGEGSFWKHRPFTRIVRGWRKAFRIAVEYVELNFLEAEGLISRMQIKTLKDLRMVFDDH